MFNKNYTGYFFGISGYIILVFVDSVIKKFLLNDYPLIKICFFISGFSFIPLFIVIIYNNQFRYVFFTSKIALLMIRGILNVTAFLLIFQSFKKHSFGEIYPILFSAPLILTIISIFILKESVNLKRWLAVIIGFVGVLMIARPGTIHFSIEIFGLLFAAIIFASTTAIIRSLHKTHSSLSVAFYGNIASFIFSGLITLNQYQSISGNDLIFFIFSGIFTATAWLCIIKSSIILESSMFAPIQYTQLAFGFILGFLIFYDVPDFFEIFGSLVILGSGLFIIYNNNENQKPL